MARQSERESAPLCYRFCPRCVCTSLLVPTRGHRIEEIEEVPLVVCDAIESIPKTKEAVALLKSLRAYCDVVKVSNLRKLRASKGKMRNRRHRQRRGPLLVVDEDGGIVKVFRNLPGVGVVNVRRLNLLQLALGGHIGRFVIWAEGVFALLDVVFGTFDKAAVHKKYHMFVPNHFTRIIPTNTCRAACPPQRFRTQMSSA